MNNMFNGIIYKATNIITGKVYIGQTKENINLRINHHIGSMKRGSKTYFHNALRKYGKENFLWEIIDIANNRNELNLKECFWIKEYNSFNSKFGYNMTFGGNQYELTEEARKKMIGHIVTEETRNKISESHKGIPLSEEHKKTLSLSHKGLIPSEEARRKISMKNTGHPVSDKTRYKISKALMGHPVSEETRIKIGKNLPSDETREKMSKAARGRIFSLETRMKISNAGKGRKCPKSDETRRKISDSLKGKKMSTETKLKLSLIRKGIPKSEEQKQKLREAYKNMSVEKRNNITDATKRFFKNRREHMNKEGIV
jgi:group I intron endonuclease